MFGAWPGGVAGTRVLVPATSQKVRLGMPRKLNGKSFIGLIMMTLDGRNTDSLLRHHTQHSYTEANSSLTI